jgi:hypothetical protein
MSHQTLRALIEQLADHWDCEASISVGYNERQLLSQCAAELKALLLSVGQEARDRYKYGHEAMEIVVAIKREIKPDMDENDGGEIYRWILDLLEKVQAVGQEAPPDKVQWTLDNVFTVARREARRASDGKPLRPEMWAHVLRLCEQVGCQERTVGILRAEPEAVGHEPFIAHLNEVMAEIVGPDPTLAAVQRRLGVNAWNGMRLLSLREGLKALSVGQEAPPPQEQDGRIAELEAERDKAYIKLHALRNIRRFSVQARGDRAVLIDPQEPSDTVMSSWPLTSDGIRIPSRLKPSRPNYSRSESNQPFPPQIPKAGRRTATRRSPASSASTARSTGTSTAARPRSCASGSRSSKPTPTHQGSSGGSFGRSSTAWTPATPAPFSKRKDGTTPSDVWRRRALSPGLLSVAKDAQRAISRTCQQQLRARIAAELRTRCTACDAARSQTEDQAFAKCAGCRHDHAQRERNRRSRALAQDCVRSTDTTPRSFPS